MVLQVVHKEGNWCSAHLRIEELVHLLFSREGKMCPTVFRRMEQVHDCYQENETGALLFSGEGFWCSTVLRRKKLVHFCSQGEGNWCTTVLRRRKLVHYCSQEKETGSLLYLEGNRCTTVFRRRKLVLTVLRRRGLVLYCSRETTEKHHLIYFTALHN